MRVNVVDNLGSAWVSYGKDSVDLSRFVYESVPVSDREELTAMTAKACSDYHKIVQEAKSKGEKIKPMSVKKGTLDNLRRWVKMHQTQDIKVVKSVKPRIPSDNEIPRVVQKQSYFSDITVSKDDLSAMFDNFDSDTLSDELIERAEDLSVSVNLDDDLFDGDDLLNGIDGLDDF